VIVKNIVDKISTSLGFTKNETVMVLFLLLTFVVGASIRLYEAYIAPSPNEHGKSTYDYSEADSEFYTRSAALPGIFGADSNSVASFQPGRLNLNTATKEDLMMLPGIGEAFAERIILYRQDHGAFRRIEDLRKVKGIGGRKFRTIKPYITVK
jgi:competence ComEA-like helix-hairpin-helix protein